MFAIASIVSFAVALILDLAGISNGHVDPQTFAILGLLFLALWAALPGWPHKP
jgi:hypothetical protein